MAKAKPDTEMRDVGYFADFGLRVARSRGYAAGYAGKLRTGDLLTAGEVVAWNEGYDRAAATVAAPFVKPEVKGVEVQSGGDSGQERVHGDGMPTGVHSQRRDAACGDFQSEADVIEACQKWVDDVWRAMTYVPPLVWVDAGNNHMVSGRYVVHQQDDGWFADLGRDEAGLGEVRRVSDQQSGIDLCNHHNRRLVIGE